MTAFAAVTSPLALAGPTGLNVIPTTDIVPTSSWIASIQNANVSFADVPLYRQPQFIEQTQVGFLPWLEAGLDYAQTPDGSSDTFVFNVKAQVLAEDDKLPNAAIGLWNVAAGQKPGYYLTISKTLNYEQAQEERFRAHHRHNRKLLGRRVHVGVMLDGHGIYQPFTGTDLQLSESAVFQADWVHGPGNAATAGVAFLFSDGRTVFTPSIVMSNDNQHFGLLLNFSHQFNL